MCPKKSEETRLYEVVEEHGCLAENIEVMGRIWSCFQELRGCSVIVDLILFCCCCSPRSTTFVQDKEKQGGSVRDRGLGSTESGILQYLIALMQHGAVEMYYESYMYFKII